MEVSRAAASTVEDFTEADFTDVVLWGSASDPTATMTDTIPTHTMTTTTMTAAATLSVAACIPATAGGFDRSRSADNMLPEKTRRFRPAGFFFSGACGGTTQIGARWLNKGGSHG